MLRVGLTGGIACGKSTVAVLMRKRGCAVLDADSLAHDLIEPGQPAYADIVKEFGEGVLNADGKVNRGTLGGIVFADRAKLDRLNQIVHPRVLKATNEWFAKIAREESPAIAVVEAALLIEAGYEQQLDRLVVCWCRPRQQLKRLLARGLEAAEAERRIAAQMPMEEKKRRATDLIDCSRTLAETARQVDELVARLQNVAVT
ncbi:MAG: dephospho-CoA kinase [Candidatus Acidiferrales bacterium]